MKKNFFWDSSDFLQFFLEKTQNFYQRLVRNEKIENKKHILVPLPKNTCDGGCKIFVEKYSHHGLSFGTGEVKIWFQGRFTILNWLQPSISISIFSLNFEENQAITVYQPMTGGEGGGGEGCQQNSF